MKARSQKERLKTCWTTVKNKTIRVALIHAKLGLKGGLETRLQNYIEYFLSRGDEVTVVCSRVDEDVKLSDKVTLVKLNTRYIPKPFRPLFFYFKVKKYLANQVFDVSLSLGRTVGQDAVLAPATHLAFQKALSNKNTSLRDYMQIFLDRESYKKSKVIFAASNTVKNELIDLYNVPKQKIKILFPPFNEKRYSPLLKENKSILREKKGFKSDKKIFLFVSVGHRHKGLDFLMRLFSMLDESKYILLISGKPLVKSSLKNVIDVGYNLDLNELYALADFLIHPAKYESFGQIVTESIYMKTPVLISDHVGAKQLITLNEGLVLPEGNVEAWLQAIESVDPLDFKFETDFVKENQLSLDDHMKKMLLALNF